MSNTDSPPQPASDEALYGKDDTQRIVAIHPILGSRKGEGATVKVYRRDPAGMKVSAEEERLYPFFFLHEMALLVGFPRHRYRFQELDGALHFAFLVVFEDWNSYWDALRHIEQKAASRGATNPPFYRINNPTQQYLMQSGRTLFKGMGFDDLHRMQLDIETYTEEGFPNASRPDDAIIIIALSDNRGWSHLIHAKELGEKEMLEELVRIIQERDPDVIEGHNIFAFDFTYISTRCKRHGVPFAIGRDGSVPRTFSSSMRFAERSIDFPALDIAGRHIVDTYFQVMAFDVFKRNLPGYGLKVAAQYFGFAPDDRIYIPGEEIPRVWREDPDKLLKYAYDDVYETERLARHLSGSTYYLTQMLPMGYGQAARTGPAAKIEALYVREYLRQRHSIPKSEWGSQSMGGYTDVFFTGVAGPIIYADVESLYPSIMLNYGVQPGSDELGLFAGLLRRLTDLRFEAKDKMAEAKTQEERGELDARQNSYKLLINSFYGNLGFSMAAFNDFGEADRVASIGQQILRRIIKTIHDTQGQVIEVDTDGVLFVPPSGIDGEAAEREFVDGLNEAMPEGIRIGYDGRFEKMLSYKKKNYALLQYDGKLKFKGSSLVSRSIERFGRQFVGDAIRLLIDEDFDGLHTLYLKTRDNILQHKWPDGIDSFSRTETLKEHLAQYEKDIKSNRRPRAAAYELAKARAQSTGQPARKGDRISYYVGGSGTQVASFEAARLANEWQPDNPDENTAYYLKRLDEFARKFEPFFSEHHFRQIFSPEDLFGFQSDDIVLRNRETPPENLEEHLPF